MYKQVGAHIGNMRMQFCFWWRARSKIIPWTQRPRKCETFVQTQMHGTARNYKDIDRLTGQKQGLRNTGTNAQHTYTQKKKYVQTRALRTWHDPIEQCSKPLLADHYRGFYYTNQYIWIIIIHSIEESVLASYDETTVGFWTLLKCGTDATPVEYHGFMSCTLGVPRCLRLQKGPSRELKKWSNLPQAFKLYIDKQQVEGHDAIKLLLGHNALVFVCIFVKALCACMALCTNPFDFWSLESWEHTLTEGKHCDDPWVRSICYLSNRTFLLQTQMPQQSTHAIQCMYVCM